MMLLLHYIGNTDVVFSMRRSGVSYYGENVKRLSRNFRRSLNQTRSLAHFGFAGRLPFFAKDGPAFSQRHVMPRKRVDSRAFALHPQFYITSSVSGDFS